MWTLVIDSGKHRGRQVKLTGESIVIGRSDDAKIRIGSGEVSREHCTLRPTQQGVMVEDHGSRNGTHINDVRIETEMLLSAGNRLTVGPMQFRLVEIPEGLKLTSQRARAEQKLSDKDIADWLTESGAPSMGETTIIGGTVPPPLASEDSSEEDIASQDGTSEPQRWVPPASKTRFDSIAEEAADVIRRHQEMLKAEEGEK